MICTHTLTTIYILLIIVDTVTNVCFTLFLMAGLARNFIRVKTVLRWAPLQANMRAVNPVACSYNNRDSEVALFFLRNFAK